MKTTALLGLLPAMVAANAKVPWSISGAPADGLTDVSFAWDISEAKHWEGYYFAMEYGSPNSNLGYCGLQTRPDKGDQNILHAVFSSFEDNATTDDENCSSGADGGGGVSCKIEIPAPYDSNYTVNVHKTAEDTWAGTLVDTTLGNSTHIGSYKLPSGAGNIEDGYIGFIENYSCNGAATCTNPETIVTFYAPYSSAEGTEGHITTPTFYGDGAGSPFEVWKRGDGYRILYGGDSN
ncbi:hypothetical protein KEM56_000058 [Ascosphaera pollenicola]|nr:hypothetical protein KEM56_000058 [Ascosphaera pollenicola]